MNRSMWTAATGMSAQQLNIDVISNNLSNTNTTGFKAEKLEFKDLMYQEIKNYNKRDDVGRPVNLEVGYGVMPSATNRNYEAGSLQDTGNVFDVAILGENAFFEIQLPDGDRRYTRDGSFKLSVKSDGINLTTSDGYNVVNSNGAALTIPRGLNKYAIDELGNITGIDENERIVEIGQLELKKFINPKGLLAEGFNLYKSTEASGEAQDLEEGSTVKVRSKYLEASNVKPVKEMIHMITAQRAYELSSKAITTSDEMLQIVNNLRR